MIGQRYIYRADLQEIDVRRPVLQPSVLLQLGMVATPPAASTWEVELESHPNAEFAAFLVQMRVSNRLRL